jgi:hypothetical protein
MMKDLDLMPAVKQGFWFHAGVTLCPVRIVQHHTLYGTHDPEDPPGIAVDRATDCFYIRYQPPGSPHDWQDGGTALSLREAVFLVQRKLGPSIQWND